MPLGSPSYSKVDSTHELTDLGDNHIPTPNGHPAEESAPPTGFVLRWWMWEITMALVAAVSFIVLIAILANYDHQEERRFGPLTLNAINAIVSTITSSSVLAFVDRR